MWCPHDIGRDSWVWGEQETLYNIISPHEVGEEAVTDVELLVGRKRGGPWVEMIVVVVVVVGVCVSNKELKQGLNMN